MQPRLPYNKTPFNNRYVRSQMHRWKQLCLLALSVIILIQYPPKRTVTRSLACIQNTIKSCFFLMFIMEYYKHLHGVSVDKHA